MIVTSWMSFCGVMTRFLPYNLWHRNLHRFYTIYIIVTSWMSFCEVMMRFLPYHLYIHTYMYMYIAYMYMFMLVYIHAYIHIYLRWGIRNPQIRKKCGLRIQSANPHPFLTFVRKSAILNSAKCADCGFNPQIRKARLRIPQHRNDLWPVAYDL